MCSAPFQVHAKHGYKNFFLEMCHLVICGWKQIVFSILVGSWEKKLLAGRPSFRLVKNAFLKTFCNKL